MDAVGGWSVEEGSTETVLVCDVVRERMRGVKIIH